MLINKYITFVLHYSASSRPISSTSDTLKKDQKWTFSGLDCERICTFHVLTHSVLNEVLFNGRNKNVEMQVTLENTKQASVLLIRKLFLLMQNLDALPNKVYLTMKLYYYDDSEGLWGSLFWVLNFR